MYNVEISSYKGPFDVLLELIDKDKMDIFDIPINEITEKFLNYINTSQEIDVEMSSDFLVMASRLLEIKSKMLIPVEKDNIEEDPRLELSKNILEYKIFKDVSLYLNTMHEESNNFVFKPMDEIDEKDEALDLNFDLNNLSKVLVSLLTNKRTIIKEEPSSIRREKYSVKKMTNDIVKKFKKNKKVKLSEFIPEIVDVAYVITLFISVLELIQNKVISYEQEATFSDIDFTYLGDNHEWYKRNN